MNKRIIKNIFLLITSAIICLVMSMTASAVELVEGDYTYTVENGVATITEYNGEGGEIVIPSELGGYTVTGIGGFSFFYREDITNIEFTDNITTIGEEAFAHCTNLTIIEIPKSVLSIGVDAFYGCTNLTKILVDSENPNYASDSFGVLFNKDMTEILRYPTGNTITEYSIPNSVISIGNSAFLASVKLTSIKIGENVVSIGDEAFRRCEGLTSIEIPDSVTNIGYASFSDCSNLKDINMPESITYIGNYAFSGTDIRSFKIPHGITDLSGGMFYECCNLLTVEIPNGVIDLGWATFELCYSLKYIYIPSSVATIDDYSFFDCTSLKAVFYEGSEEDWNRINIGKENESLTEAILNFNTSFYKNVDKESIILDCSIPIVNQKMHEYLFLYYDKNDHEEFEKTIIGDLIVKSDLPYKSLGTLATNFLDFLKKMGGNDEYRAILNIAERIVINEWTAVPSELFVNDCLLEQIYLNESVRKINNNSFACCNNLRTIYVANKNCSIKNAGLNGNAIVYCSESSIAYSEAKEAGYNVVAHEVHCISWDIVNKGSCGVVGMKKGVCSICGYTEYEESYQHPEEILPAVSATCTSTGLTDGIKCLACGEILVEQTITEILPHSMEEWVTIQGPTCTESGEEKRECANCNYYETNTLDAKGHTEETIPAVSATCTSTGLTEGVKCLACGEILVEQTIIEMIPHSMGDWETIQESTCTEAGEEKRECANCDYCETNTLNAKGHNEVTDEAVAATCYKTGLTEGRHCSTCGTVIVAQEETPKTSHDDSDNNGYCDYCDENLVEEDEDCSCNCHKSGFMGFIWKIINFFYRIFRTNKICACGATHY